MINEEQSNGVDVIKARKEGELSETLDYKSMDKETLHKLYSPSAWCKRMSPELVVNDHVSMVTKASVRAKASLHCTLDVQYGPTSQQRLDILSAASTPGDAAIVVFIHGGYWQALGREISSYMAIPLVEAGATLVTIGYDLAPNVSITEIVSQVRRAVQYVLQMAYERHSRGVYLVGHSAGAHLAAMSLSDQHINAQLADLLKGVLLVCGVFDLRPLLYTPENDVLKMTSQEVWLNSPISTEHTAALAAYGRRDKRVSVVTAENDTPEFRRQSELYHRTLKRLDVLTQLLDIDGVDHFDTIESLSDPSSQLTKHLLALIKGNNECRST